jgi:hypothetical protein
VNKTDDIEWEIRRVLSDGPMTLSAMEEKLPAEIRNDDRRWIGVAVHRMLGDGRIRATGCTHSRHEGDCVVEASK